jgi:hypothetical protein
VTMLEDRPMEMPEGTLPGAKFNADIPKATKTHTPWFVGGKGWTLVRHEYAARRNAEIAGARAAHVIEAHAQWEATNRPTKWPVKHQVLLSHVRDLARAGWRWSWNPKNHAVYGVEPGHLYLLHDDGTEQDFASLDDAAVALLGEIPKGPARTSKAQLVKYLTSVLDLLPADVKGEGAALLEKA